MGKRPTSRVGFDNWASIETSKGVYDFTGFDNSNSMDNYRVYTTTENQFTLRSMSVSLPKSHRENRPYRCSTMVASLDPETRQAAKNFVAAYVQHMLKALGNLTLTIDYEIMSNYRLSVAGSESRASDWADWYVEAAAVARKAAPISVWRTNSNYNRS